MISTHSVISPPALVGGPLRTYYPPLTRKASRVCDEGVVLRVLSNETSLSGDERDLISRLGAFRGSVQAGRSFWRDGEPAAARVIISGWACRQRTLPDGRRQIFGFMIPGDSIGLAPDPRPMDALSTIALTRVECIDALLLREILATRDPRHSRLAVALAIMRRREEAFMLDHIVRLGRQSALERTAHLFLEMRERCIRADLMEGETFPMPLTQEVLSDALGLSIVHLNRTLQQMKRDDLIEIRGGRMCILNLARMKSLANFGPHDA